MKINYRTKDFINLSVGDTNFLLNSVNPKKSDFFKFYHYIKWMNYTLKGSIPFLSASNKLIFDIISCTLNNFYMTEEIDELYKEIIEEERKVAEALGQDDQEKWCAYLANRMENCFSFKNSNENRESLEIGNCKVTPLVNTSEDDCYLLLFKSPSETVLWADAIFKQPDIIATYFDNLKIALQGNPLDKVVVNARGFKYRILEKKCLYLINDLLSNSDIPKLSFFDKLLFKLVPFSLEGVIE